MADKMQFDLVSPERRLASMEVSAVQIPGADGDLTAMPDHAPMITTLRPGILKIEGADGGDGDQSYFVTGGFADVAGPSTTILAEQAMPVAEVTADVMDGLIADATAKRDAASADAADAAAKFLADLVAAKEAL